MSGRNGNGNKERIITGPGDGPQQPDGPEDLQIPAMNHYWVIWFNPESEKIERVELDAHTVEIYDDGMLVFKGFVKNEDPAQLAMGAPPMYGFYVSSFRNHIRFGQVIVPAAGQVH
jgi:hypothetical protein